MTREEAITILNMVEAHGSLVVQAKDMAIKALEQDPCGDCVSRKAILNKKELIELPDGQSFYSIDPENVKNMPPVTPIQKWIPVSERLPENSGNYLITYCLQDKIETQEAVYLKDEKEDKWYDITDIEITLAAIAWMPLPEPYKVESEEV